MTLFLKSKQVNKHLKNLRIYLSYNALKSEYCHVLAAASMATQGEWLMSMLQMKNSSFVYLRRSLQDAQS